MRAERIERKIAHGTYFHNVDIVPRLCAHRKCENPPRSARSSIPHINCPDIKRDLLFNVSLKVYAL